jgi:hypothetical protein
VAVEVSESREEQFLMIKKTRRVTLMVRIAAVVVISVELFEEAVDSIEDSVQL